MAAPKMLRVWKVLTPRPTSWSAESGEEMLAYITELEAEKGRLLDLGRQTIAVHEAKDAHITKLEIEIQLMRREMCLAFDIIDKLPEDALANIDEAKLLEIVRAMEDATKRADMKTFTDRQTETIKRADALAEFLDKFECDDKASWWIDEQLGIAIDRYREGK